MRVEDITTFASIEKVRKILKEQENRLLNLASKIRDSKPRDEKHLCLHNFVVYAANQIKYLSATLDYPTEFLAWIARNLFELSLLVRYVSLSPDTLKEYSTELANDEIEVLEGMKGMVPADENATLHDITDRIKALKNVTANYDRVLHKHKSAAELAKGNEMENEHKAFFKLYSKYVHPSAWLIHGSTERVHRDEIKKTFLVQAQLYAGIIAKIVSDETGIGV